LATKLSFAIPGDIDTPTGGYAYDRRLIAELRQAGWPVAHIAWASSFPFPDARDKDLAAKSLAALADGSLVLIDGLAYGALPALAEAEGRRLRLVALVHHPLALETGLAPVVAAHLADSERRALAMARAVIATSASTAETLIRDYAVRPERLQVARPGSDPAPPARGPADETGIMHLLAVGTVTLRKGHDLLVEALARLADLPWRCSIAGSLDLDPGIVADIRRRIADHGLEARVQLLGAPADLAPLYHSADIFVLASRHEGYGMVFAEALQHGLPIVATTAGAIPESVPASAGLLVPPDDVAALAEALARLIADPALRRQLAAGARASSLLLPSWRDTARSVAEPLKRVAVDVPASDCPVRG
jgi:glycosyltransferase involved in cell wall biosynthesis